MLYLKRPVNRLKVYRPLALHLKLSITLPLIVGDEPMVGNMGCFILIRVNIPLVMGGV